MAKRLEKLNSVNWKCDFQGSSNITVGTVFQLSCYGKGVNLDFKNLKFILSKEEAYKIKLLGVAQSQENFGEFLVTSYKTGQYNNETLLLTDGVNTLQLGPISWTVKSVLNTKEELKMFPLYEPLTLQYPFWLWVVLVVVFLIPTVIGIKTYKYRQRRNKIREKLERENQSQPPFQTLHKEFRKLDRQIFYQEISSNQYLTELNHILKNYVVHELILPVDNWKTSDVLSEIKKNHISFFKKEGHKIKRMFHEIERATSLTSKDIEQVRKMCLLRTEEIYTFASKR